MDDPKFQPTAYSLPPTASSISDRLRQRTRYWARKRHGNDVGPYSISTRRIYIAPTRLGLLYGAMVFVLFLGSMNYSNNLALALTFVLGAVGLVAMHHCQRNLAGLQVAAAATPAVFAGQTAQFAVALDNPVAKLRCDIAVSADQSIPPPCDIEPERRAVAAVPVPAQQRGRLLLEHVQASSDYPFGLFRAWTHIHIPMSCIVYPRPETHAQPPPPLHTDTGGAQNTERGAEDFAGLRTFHAGDSPRHIAWKAYAREQGLHVKLYAGTAVTSHMLDWENLPGLAVEARLSCLCRWIEDAHANNRAYGLRIPGLEVEPNLGAAHRQRCLTALALFGLSDSRTAS
jgi:uncharacterized protein (DUF58 family)